jgi:hypothetical protein
MKKISILILGYFTIIISLFLYSYTQVDLSLTLSRSSIYQTVEKAFQYIGYFNRPLSTYLFCIIVGLLFIFYGIFLQIAKQKKINLQTFWKIIIPISLILMLSYNAFSYDLFNYIFYIKIILHYHQNPYLVTALDFPKDPMLSFMHWTHNTYPYGPFWLILTLPLGFLGFNYFLPTFFIFKFFSAFCFLTTVFFISKILKKIAPEFQVIGTVFYALNPLVLIESLVSAHNDVAMMALAVIGFYFFIEKKWIWGILAGVLSALAKQATVFLLLPFALYSANLLFKKKLFSEKWFILSCAIISVLGFILVITKIEIQPWYCLWFLPFIVFARPNKIFLWITAGFSLGTILRYVPFLWQGDWNGQASFVKLLVTVVSPILFFLLGIIYGTKSSAKK